MASTLDWVIFLAAPVVAIFLMMLHRITDQYDEIRDNWTAYRCNPFYMPFSSWFDPHTSTADNFSYCTASMAKEVVRVPLDSIQQILANFTGTLRNVGGSLNVFRALWAKLSGVMLFMTTQTVGKLTGMVSGLTFVLQKIMDVLRRMVGGGTLAAFFGYVLFSFVKSMWNLAISVIQAFVIAMLIIAAALALFNPVFLGIVIAISASFAAAGGFSTF